MSNAYFSLALTYVIWSWICFVMIRQSWIFLTTFSLRSTWQNILSLPLFLAKIYIESIYRIPYMIPHPLKQGCIWDYQSWSCVDVFLLQPSSQIQNYEYENEENTIGGYEVIVNIHYPIISYCYLICIFFKNLKLGQMSR